MVWKTLMLKATDKNQSFFRAANHTVTSSCGKWPWLLHFAFGLCETTEKVHWDILGHRGLYEVVVVHKRTWQEATRQTQLTCTQWRNSGWWMAGWMDDWTDGGWVERGVGGNVSRGRPSTDDKRPPLQLSQVDPHLCAIARLPHPNLETTTETIPLNEVTSEQYITEATRHVHINHHLLQLPFDLSSTSPMTWTVQIHVPSQSVATATDLFVPLETSFFIFATMQRFKVLNSRRLL